MEFYIWLFSLRLNPLTRHALARSLRTNRAKTVAIVLWVTEGPHVGGAQRRRRAFFVTSARRNLDLGVYSAYMEAQVRARNVRKTVAQKAIVPDCPIYRTIRWSFVQEVLKLHAVMFSRARAQRSGKNGRTFASLGVAFLSHTRVKTDWSCEPSFPSDQLARHRFHHAAQRQVRCRRLTRTRIR